MSHNLLIKPPAQVSLRPSPRQASRAGKNITQQFQAHFPGCQAFRYPGDYPEPSGHYRLDLAAGHSLFAKVLPRNNCNRQAKADQLARFLAHSGASVQAPLPGFPRHFDSRTALLAMPFLEGDYAQPTCNQMRKLGANLARLHLCMRKTPFAEEARTAADRRMATLLNAREAILAGKEPGGPADQELTARVAETPLDLHADDCQMIHGDLTVANVLFDENDTPVFLDFEDALYSWFPPNIDVAMAFERFILVFDGLNESAKLDLANALLCGYTGVTGVSPLRRRGELQAALQWLAVRSLVTLAVHSWEKQQAPDEEWHKFVYLYDDAERSAELLGIAETEFVQNA